MRHPKHKEFVAATQKFAEVRKAFAKLVDAKVILGNDNHIGDIGEYWARRYYEQQDQFSSYGEAKNALFDIQLKDGTGVSVKTLSSWSRSGYGTQVKPLTGENWQILFALRLRDDLFPERIAIVPFADLLRQPVFAENEKRRTRSEKRTKSFPRFEWWDWLANYEVSFSLADGDLVLKSYA